MLYERELEIYIELPRKDQDARAAAGRQIVFMTIEYSASETALHSVSRYIFSSKNADTSAGSAGNASTKKNGFLPRYYRRTQR